MKRILIILIILLPSAVLAQQPDSSRFAALSGKLAEYYDALKYESIDVQKQECDFLVESASDPLVRQFVAQDIYDHYINSPVMGAENVAVHVFDRWFADGKLKMRTPEEFADAQAYAAFNRQSLVGEHAPSLLMKLMDGTDVEVFGDGDHKGSFRILYFYDTDCAVCRVETLRLRELLREKDYPVEFYAIYAGDDYMAWREYVSEALSVDGAVHLWDPELDSDFQRRYGVTRTPRLLLVAPDGVIVGRGLDAQALETMLEGVFAPRSLNYGMRESETLFDEIFSMYSGYPSEHEVSRLADYIHDKTLSSGDTLMFRQMSGDYLYYLSSHSGEGFKEGLRYHIDKNILSQDRVWTSSDDSLKVVGFAQMMSDLLSKSVPGTGIPPVKVPGELRTWRGSRSAAVRLDRLSGKKNIVIFYTEGCEVCAGQKKEAQELLERATDRELSKAERAEARRTKVFMVNMDNVMASDPGLASRLMDAFDLSSLPYIIITGSDGVILRRYVSLLS